MLGLGIRKAIKSQVKRLLGRGETSEAPVRTAPPSPAPLPPNRHDVSLGDKARPARAYDVKVSDELEEENDHGHSHARGHSHDHHERAPVSAAAPVMTAPEPEEDDDVVGAPILGSERELTAEGVEAVLDEMVRPALQADGGDIAFVKIEENDVYVRLVGSCSSCPSSILTMKMGVERLLQEEFPEMGSLVQVEDPPPSA